MIVSWGVKIIQQIPGLCQPFLKAGCIVPSNEANASAKWKVKWFKCWCRARMFKCHEIIDSRLQASNLFFCDIQALLWAQIPQRNAHGNVSKFNCATTLNALRPNNRIAIQIFNFSLSQLLKSSTFRECKQSFRICISLTGNASFSTWNEKRHLWDSSPRRETPSA